MLRRSGGQIVAEYPAKHFRGANLVLLENFCRARAFAAQCDEEIRKHGLLIEGKANPCVQMRTAAWAEHARVCDEAPAGDLQSAARRLRKDPAERNARLAQALGGVMFIGADAIGWIERDLPHPERARQSGDPYG